MEIEHCGWRRDVVEAEIAAETEAETVAETEATETREVKTVATEYRVINAVINKNLCERINAEA
jgi:hypothetical protein